MQCSGPALLSLWSGAASSLLADALPRDGDGSRHASWCKAELFQNECTVDAKGSAAYALERGCVRVRIQCVEEIKHI